ncbi:hypothetical protein QCN27_06000 [Cereibacter sp. SYSU M97828]|nr:hypothetical protein [Cereibacter flavus]
MSATEHLEKLRTTLNRVFDQTISQGEISGQSHYFSTCLFEVAQQLSDSDVSRILETVASQLESANLFSAFGLYRQAFAALRLALEMGLGSIYFSVNRLYLNEWLDGRQDIVWSKLINDDDGVLSVRYAKAFFPELTLEIASVNKSAKRLYRELSEFVHGNYETWEASGLSIKYEPALRKQYQDKCKETFDVILFALSCRHLKGLSESSLDKLDFIREEFNHIGPIREVFGGPGDI